MRIAVLATLISLGTGCQVEHAPESDQRLKAAIAEGHWPQESAREEHNQTPYRVADERYDAALDQYRYTAKLALRYQAADGTTESEVNESTELTIHSSGAYHLSVRRQYQRVDDPSGESSREGVYDGHAFYTRLNQGAWMLRNQLRDDHARWRTEATEHLATIMKLLGENVRIETQDRIRRLSLPDWVPVDLPDDLSIEQALRSEGAHWYAAWQQTHRPRNFRGTFYLHPSEDLITRANLSFRAETTAQREARRILSGAELPPRLDPFADPATAALAASTPNLEPVSGPTKAVLHLSLELTIRGLEEVPDLPIPTPEQLHSPRRSRPQHLIESVLGQ